MPWVYSHGSGTPPSWTWTGTNTLNQHCDNISIPANSAITKLTVYAAARSSTVSTRLILWASGGSALRQSSTFSMAVGSESAGGQDWYEKDITPYVVSSTTTFLVGLYRNPSGAHIAGTTSTGGGTAYRKTNTASFPSVASMSGYSLHDKGFYIGAFYISKPSAPSSLSVSRNSDTSQTISWTNNSSTNAPYDNIEVYRYDNITGSYYLKTTLSGSSTSYTDTTTSANRYYKYKVLATNDAGDSSYSNEDDINTTPSAPSSVTATRSSGNVEVTWSDNASNEQYYKVQRRTSTDGISWTSYSTLTSTLAAGTELYTDTSPSNYNQYKVSCTVSNPSLESTQVESNEVVILQAPEAPTGLSPDSNEVFDATDSKRFSWQHNPNDGSAQTKYSLQYKVSGGSYPGTPQYDEVSSTNEYVDIAGSTFTNGNDYIYQVKTWGDYATGSDWSTEATFKATSIPVAVITNPTAVSDYAYSELIVTWSYTQAESNSQTQYLAKLYDSSDVLLESKSVSSSVASGSSDSCTFDYTLSNTTTYKVTLQVKESDGLWSTETDVTFDTDFLQPTVPTVELSLNETNASINIAITNPDVVTEYSPEANQDSYVDNDNSSTNYNGTGETVVTNDTGTGTTIKTILLDFDLSSIIGKTITSANLVLTRKTTLTPGIDSKVNYITTSWDETTVTYGTLPTLDTTTYDDHTHTTGDNEQWDITSLIEDIADGTITDFEGLAVVATTTDGSTDTFYDSTITGSEPYISITIEPENAETVYNNVYRSIDDGDWIQILTDVPKNTTVIDYTPNIGGNNNYYIESISAAPSSNTSSESDLDVLLTGYYYINAGDGFESYVGFIGNNSVSESYNRDVILNRYEGRTYPVKYSGTQINQTIGFSSEILNELKDDVFTLVSATGAKIYRDFEGRWFYCEITGNTFNKKDNTSYQYSCTITRVEEE